MRRGAAAVLEDHVGPKTARVAPGKAGAQGVRLIHRSEEGSGPVTG